MDTEESNNLLPGFLDSIIGIRQGETRSFPLEFPQSWEEENLRGVSVKYTVSISLPQSSGLNYRSHTVGNKKKEKYINFLIEAIAIGKC